MSGIFFDGLELPQPDVNLNVGSGSQGSQTAAMLKGIEDVLVAERPDGVLVYGDTNSTLAGALAAAKLSIPLAHVEAGLRSFNRSMPEEINRVVTDHLSNLLLCPSQTAIRNLATEGVSQGVHLIGDVMLDALNWAVHDADGNGKLLLNQFGLQKRKYLLATVHRQENTDDPERLARILTAFNSLNEPIVFPVHPRSKKAISESGFQLEPHVRLIEPVGYRDMLALVSSARMVLTDSGGLQKEAYWLGSPCLTMRDETEWVETVEAGWNVLVGCEPEKILRTARSFVPPASRPALYGEGAAAATCVELIDRSWDSSARETDETRKAKSEKRGARSLRW
jgi:UDP-N-acetylglucosamine 2-epimerase